MPIFSYDGKSIPDILSCYLSRARNADIQLDSARCLTYIHRSGSLSSIDQRIIYRTLPCLARLCTDDFAEEIRASSAETLAYLTEVNYNQIVCHRKLTILKLNYSPFSD